MKVFARFSLRVAALTAILLSAIIGSMWFAMIRMPGKSWRGPLPELTETQATLRDELDAEVTVLATRIGERNLSRYESLDQAARYIETQLAEAGYDVSRQEFEVTGRTCVNLAAELPGTDKPDEIVVVGGHYDSVAGCPAANDNGTGVAATLALARRMRDHKPARTVRFVFFVNEEPPWFKTQDMGSVVYAKACRERGDNVVAMLSLETIGYYDDSKGSQRYPPPVGLCYPSEGNFIAFVGNYRSRRLVRRVVGIFRRHAQFPSEGAALPAIVPGVGWSDHWAFWQQDYMALMVTDTAPFRYPDYHLPTDTPDTLDFARTARVVEGIEAVVRELAE